MAKAETEKSEDVMKLTLKMEKGAMNQGMEENSRS